MFLHLILPESWADRLGGYMLVGDVVILVTCILLAGVLDAREESK